MDTSEEAKCPRRAGRKGAAAPLASLRTAVGLAALLAAVLTGLVGCTPPPSDPTLDAPSVVYVSRDVDSITELHIEQDRAPNATVTFDAGDLKGIAIIKTAMDICPVRLPVFHCKPRDEAASRGRNHQNFRLSPADGATAGDSAELRYRVTSPGLPTVTGSSHIVIGSPELVVDAHTDRLDVDPGGKLAVALTIRNTGDVPARGVALFMDTRDGLAPADKHSNCRYSGSTAVSCRLPAADVVIPPGASYSLGAREVFRAATDATYPRVSFHAAALGTEHEIPDHLASRYRSGDGAAMRLVPAGAQGAGTADRNWSALKVSVRNEADLAAVATTAEGPIGSLATVRVGVRNDGPGALPASARIMFTVPPGTTVVSSPYVFERSEELIDQDCRALAPDGTPLTEPSAKQPRARQYVCTAEVGAVGATTTFPFTLRIDKDVAHHDGRVAVSDGDSAHPSHDATAANDTAKVAVTVWPGPPWATPGRYLAAAIVLGVLVLATALGAWRWKRSR